MASNISTPAGRGGKAGILSENTRKQRDANLRFIKETWGVNSLEDVFPQAIKPVAEMGTTAVANMKIISNRVNELSEVRPLFSDVCKDSDGNPIPASYMHTVAVLNIIKKRAEVATSPPSATTLTPKATSRVSNKAHSAKESESREKRKENSKDTTSSKIPDGLIVPGASIAPPFSYPGNVVTSPKKGEGSAQKEKGKESGSTNGHLNDKESGALLAGATNSSLPAKLIQATGDIFDSFNKHPSKPSVPNVPKKRSIVAEDLDRLMTSKRKKNEHEKKIETNINTSNLGKSAKDKQRKHPLAALVKRRLANSLYAAEKSQKKKTLAEELFPSSEDEAPTTQSSKGLDKADKADGTTVQEHSNLPIMADGSATQPLPDAPNISDRATDLLVQPDEEDHRIELDRAVAENKEKMRSFFETTPTKGIDNPPMPDSSEYDAENTIVVDSSSPLLSVPAPPRSPSPSKEPSTSRQSLSVSVLNHSKRPPKSQEKPSRREKSSPPTLSKTSSKTPRLRAPVAPMHDLTDGVGSLMDTTLQLPGKLRALLDDELKQKLTRQHPEALLDLEVALDTAARHLKSDIEHIFRKE